ncbi:MAG: ATP-binding protein, partial [Geminicoccaceae bacterium]
GPGIPAELREHAKQRFVRLDAQRSTPGSGLGLSLVDAVAKLHQARLSLEDNGPGLRVTLEFRPAPTEQVEFKAAAA